MQSMPFCLPTRYVCIYIRHSLSTYLPTYLPTYIQTLGQIDQVLATLATLEKSNGFGEGLKPNDATYEIVMEALSHAHMYEEVVKVYQRVQVGR